MNSTPFVRLLCEPGDALTSRVAAMCQAYSYRYQEDATAEDLLSGFEYDCAGCLVVAPGSHGASPALNMIREMRSRWFNIPVLLVVADNEPPELELAALHGGAFDVCRSSVDDDELRRRVRRAVAYDRDGEGQPSVIRSRLASLSPREREVMELSLKGHNTDSMAALLGVCYQTVNKHRARIRLKMRVSCDVRLLHLLHGQPPTPEQCGYISTADRPLGAPTAPHYSQAPTSQTYSQL